MEVRTLLKQSKTSLTSCTKDPTIIILPKVHPNGLSDGIVQHLCTEDVVPVQVQGSVVVVDGLQTLLSRAQHYVCSPANDIELEICKRTIACSSSLSN